MAYVAVLNPRALVIRHAPGVILDRDKRRLLAPDIGEATAVRVAFPAFSPAGAFETDADDLRDRAAGRRAVAGEVVARDQRCGLTLIRLDRDPPSSARAARLADRVEVGAPVWRLGVRVPEGRELWEVAEGRVQSVGREAGPGRAAGSAAGRPREIVTKLDSGADAEGPLFDRRGAVLGFSRSTDDLHRTQAFVHVDEIREFLRVNKVELPPASGPEKKCAGRRRRCTCPGYDRASRSPSDNQGAADEPAGCTGHGPRDRLCWVAGHRRARAGGPVVRRLLC
jgi:hypothetical protein